MTKKILVIDDSALMRRVISDIINESNEYEVAAIAKDGLEGFDMIVSNPDLYSAVILDINMPKMNGLELLEKLQKNRIEQTVIVVSTVAKAGAKETIKALEFGAFDFVTKPENYLETKGEDFKKKIQNALNVATESRMTKARTGRRIAASEAAAAMEPERRERKSFSQTATTGSSTMNLMTGTLTTRRNNESNKPAEKINPSSYSGIKKGKNKLIALACSTGGPKSLQQVIPILPKNLDAGMVLVQHMPAGFTASLAQRLNEISEIKVKEATDGDIILNGTVYIAPGGKHMRIVKNGSSHCIKISDEPAVDGLRPCANIMYESLETSSYDEIICVVLTGMGADGTKGIKGLSSKKQIHVIAQDEDSCVVYGMPKAIAQTGLVDEVVTLNKVAETITKNVGVL